MRLDKFLKVSRLVKRRTLAKDLCDQGRVEVNNKTAKAGTVVSVGDLLTIKYGNRSVSARVESLKETTRKEEADKMYTLEETSHSDAR